MLESRRTDRRAASRDINFPLTGADGDYIGEDRRSGLDRRNYKTDNIAIKILASISF